MPVTMHPFTERLAQRIEDPRAETIADSLGDAGEIMRMWRFSDGDPGGSAVVGPFSEQTEFPWVQADDVERLKQALIAFVRMSKDTVKLIADIIRDTLRKGQPVPLHALLGTVDAQLRLIPSLEEVNEALQQVPPIRVKRRGGRVELVSSVSKTKVGVTAKDLESAFANYHDLMSGWIDELARKKSN